MKYCEIKTNREREVKCVKYWLDRNPVEFLDMYCKNHNFNSAPVYKNLTRKLKNEVIPCDPRPKFVFDCYANKDNFPHYQIGYGMTKLEAKKNVASKILYCISLRDPDLLAMSMNTQTPNNQSQ